MKKLLHLLITVSIASSTIAQTISFDKAPLNPNPLEYLRYMVPSTLKGDIAYYAGNFYDANRRQLLEDGSTFMKYAQWTKNEASAAKSIFIKFNAQGKVEEIVNYNTSTVTFLYEYDKKGQLIKYQFQNDITTYTYDNQGRLDTEFNKFGSSDRTILKKYTYKNEGDILKITKKSTYVDGEESEEFHFKNGRKLYSKTAFSNENDCEPDARGNCVSEKNKKTGYINKIYYNVIYRDELKPENITVRNIRKQMYGDIIPQTEILGRIIKLPVIAVGADAIVYEPLSKSYVKAINFYDQAKIKNDAVIPTEKIENKNNYLGLWQNTRTPIVLVEGKKANWIPYSDDVYHMFYNEAEEKYYYVLKSVVGETGKIINFNEISSPILMYMDIPNKTSTTIIKGKRQISSYGYAAKKINDQEMVLIYNNVPQYIVPIVPIPESLKIYLGRNYNGEKMLD